MEDRVRRAWQSHGAFIGIDENLASFLDHLWLIEYTGK